MRVNVVLLAGLAIAFLLTRESRATVTPVSGSPQTPDNGTNPAINPVAPQRVCLALFPSRCGCPPGYMWSNGKCVPASPEPGIDGRILRL